MTNHKPHPVSRFSFLSDGLRSIGLALPVVALVAWTVLWGVMAVTSRSVEFQRNWPVAAGNWTLIIDFSLHNFAMSLNQPAPVTYGPPEESPEYAAWAASFHKHEIVFWKRPDDLWGLSLGFPMIGYHAHGPGDTTPIRQFFWGYEYSFRVRQWIAFTAILLPAALSVLSVSRTRARRISRAALGQCLNCGYDLRASAERCPECGTVRKRITITVN
jgi:hypothetical protein